LINRASKTEIMQYRMNNSDIWEILNSVLLKIKNKRTPSKRDPILAITESTRLLRKLSNLNSSITIVSITTVNIPTPARTRPKRTICQSIDNKKLFITLFYLLKIKQKQLMQTLTSLQAIQYNWEIET